MEGKKLRRAVEEETEGPEYHRRQLGEELPGGGGHSGSIFGFTCPEDIEIGLICPLRFLGIQPQDVRNSK